MMQAIGRTEIEDDDFLPVLTGFILFRLAITVISV
jgi:hypothetical protein